MPQPWTLRLTRNAAALAVGGAEDMMRRNVCVFYY
jgi:hypothetical protein